MIKAAKKIKKKIIPRGKQIAKPTPTTKETRAYNPKGGRPPESKSRPTEEQLKEIETLSRLRLPMNVIANSIEISADTFHEWRNIYPEVKARIERGRGNSIKHAVKSCYLRAFPVDNTKGDTTMAIFLMKTMFRFKEPDKKIKIEAVKGNTQINLKVSDDAENVTALIQNHYDTKDEE